MIYEYKELKHLSDTRRNTKMPDLKSTSAQDSFNVMDKYYRTTGIPQGHISKLGSVHAHVDGHLPMEEALTLIKSIEHLGGWGKINYISEWLDGPQRNVIPDSYKSHDPYCSKIGEPMYFTSLQFPEHPSTNELLKTASSYLIKHPGTVMELEWVFANMSNGFSEELKFEHRPKLDIDNTSLDPQPTLPVEIHHAIDINLSRKALPSLQDLSDYSIENSIHFGGWYKFDRADRLSFRSNSFAEINGAVNQTIEEHHSLGKYFQNLDCDFAIRSFCEEVIGIWKVQK